MHHHPVLGPVVMHLQEGSGRVDHYPLHLEAFGRHQRFIETQGRYTRRCWDTSGRFRSFRRLTIRLTSCTLPRSATSTASAVSTTTRLVGPMPASSRESLRK